MILVGLFIGLATIFVAGFGVTVPLLRTAPRLNIVECSCLAWLFGCGAVSILLFLGGMVVSSPWLQVLVLVACLVIGLWGWKVCRGARVHFVFPWPANAVEWLLAGIMVLQIAAIFLISSKHTLGFDGLINWEMKAHYAFLNGGSIPSEYYHSDSRVFSHPQYPLMIPMTELWLYLWMAEPNQGWIRAIFPIFYGAGAILLACLSGRLTGRRWPGGLVAVLLFFVPIITDGDIGAVTGYADFPLGVFYLVVIGYLLLFLVAKEERYFSVYAVSLALLPWVKREGSILWLVGAMAGAFILWRNKGGYRFWITLASTAFILVGWRIYLRSAHVVAGDDFVALSLSTLRQNADRVIPIARDLLLELARPGNWSLFWLLAVAACFYRAVRQPTLVLLIVSAAILAPVAAYSCSYLLSKDYHWHVGTSLPRLLLQMVPVGWLMIALALRPGDSSSGIADKAPIRNG